MAKLKIFLSSTTEDLRDARRFFRDSFKTHRGRTGLRLVCYEDDHWRCVGLGPQDTCIKLVSKCRAILLLLDRHYFGSKYEKDPRISITHAEFRKAKSLELKPVPIIRKQTWYEFQVWRKNRTLPIKYPWVKNAKLFQLIKELQPSKINCYVWDDFTSSRDIAKLIKGVQGLLARRASAIVGHTTLAS